jgi:hypothetical protein
MPPRSRGVVVCEDVPVTHPVLLDDLWREQSLWSQTANRMKRRIERARSLALGLVIAVAVLGTAATELHEQADVFARVLAGLAAVGSGGLPLLRPKWSGTALKDWTRTRSVSEALKSDVYLWLAKAGPFAYDLAASELRNRTDKLRADSADLLPQREGITAENRSLPAVNDLRSYFDERVEAQRKGYYAKRTAEIARRIKRLRRVEVGLGTVGFLIGATAAVFGASLAAWVAVVATIGTALSVHVSASRYEFQLIEFSRTAEELRQIKSWADEPGVDDQGLRRLAVKAERVISVENQGWMAKLVEDPPEQTGSMSSDGQAGNS